MSTGVSSVARVAVGVENHATAELRSKAETLARELSLPLVDEEPTRAGDLLLMVRKERLELRENRASVSRPIYVDFVAGAVGFRRRAAGGKRQPIARAVGLRAGPVTVVDATAGLGRDAFLLACLGCEVTAVERSPVLGALLRDGLDRATSTSDPSLRSIVSRISLIVGDARDILQAMPKAVRPDVVYLDPMHPPKRKAALAKKEMRVCRRLVGDDPDAAELLAVARQTALKRVVVKRHRRAEPLARPVITQWLGTTVRYDVYTPQ